MKRNGFTLIELLAVIVILAIIALIATPIILGIIENASDESIERSVENYLKAVNIAVAKENMTREFNPNSCDVTETGSLDCGTLGEIPVEVDGNHPKDGTITFKNGNVDSYSNLKIDENKYANKGTNGIEISNNPVFAVICEPATSSQYGNVPSGNYAYGDEYICDPGDGIERNFFVIEDGDTTTLTTGRLAGAGQVSLIMDRNIDNSWVAWDETFDLDNGGTLNEGAATAYAYLQNQTSNWKVKRDLPSYEQLSKTKTETTDSGSEILPNWLSTNANMPDSEFYWPLYWTSSIKMANFNSYTVQIECENKETCIQNGPSAADIVCTTEYVCYTNFGSAQANLPSARVRPVITISKDDIG